MRIACDDPAPDAPIASVRPPTRDAETGLHDVHALLEVLERPTPRPCRLDLVAVRPLDPLAEPFALRAPGLAGRVGAAIAGVADPLEGRAYRVTDSVFAIVTPEIMSGGALLRPALQVALAAVDPAFGAGLLYATVSVPAPPRSGRDALGAGLAQLRSRSRWMPLSPARQARDVLLQLLAERALRGPRPSPGAVAVYAVAVGRALRLPASELDEVVRAAELQDVGMLTLPDALLAKAEPLDAAEWELVRHHPVVGERIVRAAPALRGVARLVRSCYERYDGTGYPDGLRGDEIPLGARIIAPCVAFEAMTSPRPYREPRSVPEALDELEACAGRQFDPRVVDVVRRVVERLAPEADRGAP